MGVKFNFLNSILGIRLLFIFGVILPLSVIPFYLKLDGCFARSFECCISSLNPLSMFLGGGPCSPIVKESEAKSFLGALSRAQQAYFMEYNQFGYGSFESVGIPLGEPKYYQFSIISSMTPNATISMHHQSLSESSIIGVIAVAFPQAQYKDGNDIKIRSYISGTFYDTENKEFFRRICREQSSNLDEQSLEVFSPKLEIYPYKKGIKFNQKNLTIDEIFPCPDGFKEIR